MLDLTLIDNSWTLFIDRDGVLNHEKKNDYIRNWEEFSFYEGVTDALSMLSKVFGVIVLVTNQKGVGKGLMTVEDLTNIHQNMLQEIEAKGGRIDHIFYCPDLDNDSPNRKPNPGMAFQAKTIFPQIDFNKSLMIGNKLSDMGFGRNAGIYTVFVSTTNPETPFPHDLIDIRCADLMDFAQQLLARNGQLV